MGAMIFNSIVTEIYDDMFRISYGFTGCQMLRLIADSKNELFHETDLQIANLAVLRVLQYRIISFTSQLKGHTTIYCVGSLVEKIISRVSFDMQSVYFFYFRSINL